jgi:hypothetical protein
MALRATRGEERAARQRASIPQPLAPGPWPLSFNGAWPQTPV